MTTSPTLVWALLASLFIGNTLLLVLNLPLAPVWAKLLQIPRPYLYAGILFFASLGRLQRQPPGLRPRPAAGARAARPGDAALRAAGAAADPRRDPRPAPRGAAHRGAGDLAGDVSTLWSEPVAVVVYVVMAVLLSSCSAGCAAGRPATTHPAGPRRKTRRATDGSRSSMTHRAATAPTPTAGRPGPRRRRGRSAATGWWWSTPPGRQPGRHPLRPRGRDRGAPAAGAEGVEVKVRRDVVADIADAVLDAAEGEHAGLVVVGIRQRTPVGKMLLGSVAQRVILEARLPRARGQAGLRGAPAGAGGRRGGVRSSGNA